MVLFLSQTVAIQMTTGGEAAVVLKKIAAIRRKCCRDCAKAVAKKNYWGENETRKRWESLQISEKRLNVLLKKEVWVQMHGEELGQIELLINNYILMCVYRYLYTRVGVVCEKYKKSSILEDL